MGEIATIEEFILGREGDESKGLAVAIDTWKEQAREEGVEILRIDAKTTANGTTSYNREFTATFRTSDPTDSICNAIRQRLEQSPGDSFSGKIRIFCYESGNTSNRMGSFQRTMRAPLTSGIIDSVGGPAAGDLKAIQATVQAVVKPFADMLIRQQHAAAELVNSAANLVKAQHPPQAANNAGYMGDLLRGVVGVASAAQQQPSPEPAYPQQVGGGVAPPGPPGMPQPIALETQPPPAPPSVAPVAPPAPALPDHQSTTPPDLRHLSPEQLTEAIRQWIRADPARKQQAINVLPSLMSEVQG